MGRRAPRRYDGEDYDGSSQLTEPKQELFCALFNSNTTPHFWANAQNCYEFAYGFTDRIESLEDKMAVVEKKIVDVSNLPKKKRPKGVTISSLERERDMYKESIRKIRRDCARSASRLMVIPNIRLRCGFLLNNLAKDLIVDQELSYLIQQRENLQVKQNAIAHYDKKMQRITDRLDIKHAFEPVKTIRMNPAKKPA